MGEERRNPREMVDTICKHWVAHFGTATIILSRDASKLTGEEMMEIKRLFDVEDITPTEDTPWKDGFGDRGHRVEVWKQNNCIVL